jgi:SAM-dependent methyltransferase
MAWWQDFFDDEYIRLWGGWLTDERTRADVEGLCALAGIGAGTRVLDAPCGFGRISRALAKRGAIVLGVDQAQPQIARAERTRGDGDAARLRYQCRDLRHGLDEGGFEVALNVFSSLGYGSEEDDLAVLRTLHAALAPGGQLVVETAHRDRFVLMHAQGGPPGDRLADGTLIIEQPRLDAKTGRVETTWHWSGPAGSGSKSASMRLYTTDELVRLVQRAGFEEPTLHAGCSTAPFELSGRVSLLARR